MVTSPNDIRGRYSHPAAKMVSINALDCKEHYQLEIFPHSSSRPLNGTLKNYFLRLSSLILDPRLYNGIQTLATWYASKTGGFNSFLNLVIRFMGLSFMYIFRVYFIMKGPCLRIHLFVEGGAIFVNVMTIHIGG